MSYVCTVEGIPEDHLENTCLKKKRGGGGEQFSQTFFFVCTDEGRVEPSAASTQGI